MMPKLNTIGAGPALVSSSGASANRSPNAERELPSTITRGRSGSCCSRVRSSDNLRPQSGSRSAGSQWSIVNDNASCKPTNDARLQATMDRPRREISRLALHGALPITFATPKRSELEVDEGLARVRRQNQRQRQHQGVADAERRGVHANGELLPAPAERHQMADQH